MDKESKKCQNCHNEFWIESDDFAFYEKMKVPAPTFCFYCRVQRRMAFRNERTLYKRSCNAEGHSEQLISIFSPDNFQKVYDHATWWSDSWDALLYGKDMNWDKPFLSQIKDLWREVPDVALLNINPVNSEYCSITEGNKNCYLVFGGDFNENTMYSTYTFNSKECVDTYWVSKGELNYETVDCIGCSRLLYSRYCEECYNAAFLFDCKNCRDCFGCVGLRNKQYYIFNQQYSKSEYEQKIKEFDITSATKRDEVWKKFQGHMLLYPRKFARIIQSINSTGDNLQGTKNCKNCFDVFGGAEDSKYVWLAYSKVSDSMDIDRSGVGTALGYDCSTIYPGSRVLFSRFTFNSQDVYYSYNNHNCSYIFGCIGLRNKQYCILNKQYTKEEYEAMLPKLIEHMNNMPYIDKKGRVYKYGEFFPVEISPFAYNETIAQEMFPLTKAQALEQGFSWKEPDVKKNIPTKKSEEIPDRIQDVQDTITNEILECEHKGQCQDQCTLAFKIMPAELIFYRSLKIPLPKLCPSCRHYKRAKQRNPIKLWTRHCDCRGINSANGNYENEGVHYHGKGSCINEFETTYSSDRPEIVYCEQCYQSEVA